VDALNGYQPLPFFKMVDRFSKWESAMGWELKERPSTQKVTGKLAAEFAEMEAAHVDRALSERRLQVYRKVREEGGFRPVTWARAFCKETGETYRVNGKHTSTLFADGKMLDGIYVTIEDYVCDTLEDVAKLYATFDSATQSRTTTDINRSFAAVIPELAHIDGRSLSLIVSALSFSPTGDGQVRGTPAERAEALFDNVELSLWLHQYVVRSGSARFNPLARVPVVAAMIGSYHRSKSAAKEFWDAVRDETGARPDLPDRKLAKFLATTVSHTANSDKSSRFRIKAREYFIRCLKAWNAWRKGEPTDLKYFADAKIPAFV
jgi:hypothetical protein